MTIRQYAYAAIIIMFLTGGWFLNFVYKIGYDDGLNSQINQYIIDNLPECQK